MKHLLLCSLFLSSSATLWTSTKLTSPIASKITKSATRKIFQNLTSALVNSTQQALTVQQQNFKKIEELQNTTINNLTTQLKKTEADFQVIHTKLQASQIYVQTLKEALSTKDLYASQSAQKIQEATTAHNQLTIQLRKKEIDYMQLEEQFKEIKKTLEKTQNNRTGIKQFRYLLCIGITVGATLQYFAKCNQDCCSNSVKPLISHDKL